MGSRQIGDVEYRVDGYRMLKDETDMNLGRRRTDKTLDWGRVDQFG